MLVPEKTKHGGNKYHGLSMGLGTGGLYLTEKHLAPRNTLYFMILEKIT